MREQIFIKESIEKGYVAHYTSIDTLLKILSSKSIKFGKVSGLNDLSEAATPTIMYSMEAFHGHYDLLQKTVQYCTKLYDRSLLAACFSKGITNLRPNVTVNDTCFGNFLLWAHYGDRWAGAALIFDPIKLERLARIYFKDQHNSNFVWSGGIEYFPNHFQNRDDSAYLSDLDFQGVNLNDNRELAEMFRLKASQNVKYLMYKKDLIWMPEQEWRVCAFSDKLDSQFMPFEDALVAVVLGPRVILSGKLKKFFENYNFYGIGKASARATLDLRLVSSVS